MHNSIKELIPMNDSITPEELDEEYDPDLLTLIDEDNQQHTFEVLDRIELDNGCRYVALLEVFDNAEEFLDDSGELVILKVMEENGEDILGTIESEEEFYDVLPLFEERLSDLFEIEEEPYSSVSEQ